MTRQQTIREHVEQNLGIPWATWRKIDDAERNEAITGKPAPAYLRVPAGPERLALTMASVDWNRVAEIRASLCK